MNAQKGCAPETSLENRGGGSSPEPGGQFLPGRITVPASPWTGPLMPPHSFLEPSFLCLMAHLSRPWGASRPLHAPNPQGL